MYLKYKLFNIEILFHYIQETLENKNKIITKPLSYFDSSDTDIFIDAKIHVTSSYPNYLRLKIGIYGGNQCDLQYMLPRCFYKKWLDSDQLLGAISKNGRRDRWSKLRIIPL